MDKILYFAPFHGITTRCFREVFFTHFSGIDVALTPFLQAGEDFTLSKARFKDIFPSNKENIPLIVQIIGRKKQEMTETVLYLYEKEYERINWNIACPMPQITRKKRGCGLMLYPDEIEQVVESICKKTTAKFSVKMRLGMYNSEESLEIINRLNNYPLDFIAIHARLGMQVYSGNTNKDAFFQCFRHSKNQLCYNGDIFSVNDYEKIRNQLPDLKLFMLGRGLLKNPFLAEQIQGKYISDEEQKNRFMNFYENLTNVYFDIFPKRNVLNRLKELWRYFAVFCKLSDAQILSLLQITDCEKFLEETKKQIV